MCFHPFLQYVFQYNAIQKGKDNCMKGGMCLKRFFLLFLSLYSLLLPTAYCADLYVNPGGKAIGVKMHTKGLIVVDVCTIEDINKTKCRLDDFNIGDIILNANGKEIENTDSLKSIINKSSDNISFTIKRHGEIENILVSPIQTERGASLGLWLRDSTAGVGTLTYYDPTSNKFGALGHGICDIDTNTLMPIQSGSIIDCNVTNVIKSKNGNIGELECDFSNTDLGSLTHNTSFGIFGVSDNVLSDSSALKVASRDEVHEGHATILVELDDDGIKEYSINIKNINSSKENGKDIVLEITDPLLLEKTGGIVQGMSGAPIIQNNLFVGALTHVFVNNPTKGYGILGEKMLSINN